MGPLPRTVSLSGRPPHSSLQEGDQNEGPWAAGPRGAHEAQATMLAGEGTAASSPRTPTFCSTELKNSQFNMAFQLL